MAETRLGAPAGANAQVIVSVYNSESACPDKLMEDLEFVRDIIFEDVYSKAGRDTKRRLNPQNEKTRKTIGILRATFESGKTHNIVAISGQGADEWTRKPVKIGKKLFDPVAKRLEQERRDITWAPLTYKHREYEKLPPGEPISPEHRQAFAKEFIMRLDNKVEALKKANLTREKLASALVRAGHRRGCTKEDLDYLVSCYESFCQDDKFNIVRRDMKAYFEAPDPVEYCRTKATRWLGDALLGEMVASISKDIVDVVQDVVMRDMETAPQEIREMCCILIYKALGLRDPATSVDLKAPAPVEYWRTKATHLLSDAAFKNIEARIRKDGVKVVQDVVRCIAPVGAHAMYHILIYKALGFMDRVDLRTPDPEEYWRTKATCLLGDTAYREIETRISRDGIKRVQDVVSRYTGTVGVHPLCYILIYKALALMDTATFIDIKAPDPVRLCRTLAVHLLVDAVFREIRAKIREGEEEIVQDVTRCEDKKKVVQDVFTRYLKPLGIPEVLLTTIGIALEVKDPPGSTTLADMTARCAEDNALKQLCKLKKNRGCVTQIEWFSASLDLSKQSCPLNHKPLCPFCAVAFER